MSLPTVGSIVFFPGTRVPAGWLLCDGSPLDIHAKANQALLGVIGSRFGTAGEWVRLPEVADPVAGVQALVCRDGALPPAGGPVTIWLPDTLGFIVPMTAASAPSGFLFCDGQTVPIEGNEALFAIVGDPIGPDPNAAASFGIPDLRPVGSYAICSAGAFPLFS